MKIACYAGGFGYPEGIHCNVTTEAKIPLSYGLLLASKGHEVDLITEGGVLHDEPPNFKFITLVEAAPKYDISICCQDSFPNPINADRYIVAFYTPTKTAALQKLWGKSCILVNRNTIDIPGTMLWARPIPVKPRVADESNFDKKNLLWVCKHNQALGLDTPHSRSFQRLMSVLSRKKKDYHTKAIYLNDSMQKYFSKVICTGLYYDKLLEELEEVKMTLTHTYGTCSLTESVLSGCLPMLWNGVGIKGGDKLLSVPDITLFNIKDTEIEFEAKLDKMLNDREYYESQWRAFYDIVKVHLWENSYAQFLEIIKEG